MNDTLVNQNNFLLYTTPQGEVKLSVLLENETIWLTQDQMSTLFQKGRSTITEHIINIFKEGELDEESTCKDFLQVQIEGNRKNNLSYCLY